MKSIKNKNVMRQNSLFSHTNDVNNEDDSAMTITSKVDCGLLNCFRVILVSGALKSFERWLSVYFL